MLDDLFVKHVELLRLVASRLSRLAVLAVPGDTNHPPVLKTIAGMARKLGIQILRVDVNMSQEFDAGFRAMARERVEAPRKMRRDYRSGDYGRIVSQCRRGVVAPLEEVIRASSPFQLVTLVRAQSVTTDKFFKALKRPSSPNNWLVAPAGFVIKANAVAPIFEAPVPVLRETFKAVVLQSKAAVLEESADGMHVVATTPLLGFKDDIRVLFISVAQNKSTIALYSASRVGYWDLGTNRRRLEDWISQTQSALASARK